MKKVSREQFYAVMDSLDAQPVITSNWPFTREWKLQTSGPWATVGKTVSVDSRGTLNYFLAA